MVGKEEMSCIKENRKKMAFPTCDLKEGGISPGGQAVLGSLCQILSPLPEVAGYCCPYSGSVPPAWIQGSGGKER